MSDSLRPHGLQPTRLPRPWDSPGKNTGVGCHFLLQCMKVKIESEVVQSCPTLSDPMDSSLPGSSSKFPGHLQKQFAKGTTQKREVELFECHTKPNYYCDKQGLLKILSTLGATSLRLFPAQPYRQRRIQNKIRMPC